jgi:hypothetical protein
VALNTTKQTITQLKKNATDKHSFLNLSVTGIGDDATSLGNVFNKKKSQIHIKYLPVLKTSLFQSSSRIYDILNATTTRCIISPLTTLSLFSLIAPLYIPHIYATVINFNVDTISGYIVRRITLSRFQKYIEQRTSNMQL